MVEQVLPINNLDEAGVILDIPSVALPPNAFSNVRNVRFKDGSVRKMKGEVNIFPNIFDDSSNLINGIAANFDGSIIKNVIWWPNPNLAVYNQGYYIIITEEERVAPDSNGDNPVIDGTTYYINAVPPANNALVPTRQRDVAYLVTINGNTKIEKGYFEPAGIGAWQHTFFQGGFCLIVNNGLNAPHYILDEENNTNANNVPNFSKLPGWESYTVDQIFLQDNFDSNSDSYIFNLGKKVNFEIEYIEILDYDSQTNAYTTFVASGTDSDGDAANSINYDAPLYSTFTGDPTVGFANNDEFEIYYDEDSNSHVIFLPSNLNHGSHVDKLTVAIKSRNPAFVTCGVIRSFGEFLVAGNLVERTAEDLDSPIIRSLNGLVRTSDVALPGSVPNNWNPYAGGVSTADEFVISNSSVVQDLVEMQGNLYIYSNNSISVMRLTGNTDVPLAVTPLTNSYGAQTTNSVIEFDGRHFVVGSQDIYVFSGHPSSIQSIGNDRVRKYLFDNLNPLHNAHLFCLKYSQKDELWICYPNLSSNIGECNEALIYNYRRNTWTIRELRNVISGIISPVPGGGLPQTDLQFTGSGGDSGIVNIGAYEVRSVGVDSTNYISGSLAFYGSDTTSNLIYNTGRNGNVARPLLSGVRRFYENKIYPTYRLTGPENLNTTFTFANTNALYENITYDQILNQIVYNINQYAEGWTSDPTEFPSGYVQYGPSQDNLTLLTTKTEGNKLGKRAVLSTEFEIEQLSTGNTLNGDNPNIDFQDSRSGSCHGITISVSNDYRGDHIERATPTFLGILLTNSDHPSGEEFVVVKAGDDGNYDPETHSSTDGNAIVNGISYNNEQIAEKIIAKLRNISPTLNVIDAGTNGEITLLPADYADVADFIKGIRANTNKTDADWIYARWAEAQAGTIGLNNNSDTLNVVYADAGNPDYAENEPYVALNTRAVKTITGSNDNQLSPDPTRVPNRTTTFDSSAPDIAYTQTEEEVFDKERPWDTDETNPNIQVPVFAARQNVTSPNDVDHVMNKVIAVDFGWSIPSYNYNPRVETLDQNIALNVITNNDAPVSYESFVERKQMGITPEFDTETINKVALWANGVYRPYVNSPANYNRFQIRMAGSDNPGQDINLSNLSDDSINHNNFFISEDYRVDMRTHGRFLNYRITDKILNAQNTEIELTSNPDSELSVVYNKQSDWQLSGMQVELRKGGAR